MDRSPRGPGPNGSDRSSAEFRFNQSFPRGLGFDSHGRPGPVQIQSLRSVRSFARSFVRCARSGGGVRSCRTTLGVRCGKRFVGRFHVRAFARSFVAFGQRSFARSPVRSFGACVRGVVRWYRTALWVRVEGASPGDSSSERSVPWDCSLARCAGPSERAKRVDRSAFVRPFVRAFVRGERGGVRSFVRSSG